LADPRIIELIPITLDKPRHLLFDRLAVKFIEVELTRIWGREYTFYQALRLCAEMLNDNDLSKLSYINVSVMLWAGCLHEDMALTLATVEEALPYADPSLLIPYIGPILQAWQAATPTAPPVELNGEVHEDTNPLDGSPGRPSGVLSGSALA
jgi:hypothetical protein